MGGGVFAPLEVRPRVVVGVRRVDAADRVERQAKLGLVAVERLEGLDKITPPKSKSTARITGAAYRHG